MDKIKNFLKAFIAVVGIVLMGYHWTEGFVAFSNPTFLNISFTLALIFWSLMFMIVLKEWVQKNIRDKWQEKSLKRLKYFCVAIIAFCVGCTLANIDILVTTLTLREILPILLLPLISTILYGLKEEKDSGWIGGDPSKGGDIDH